MYTTFCIHINGKVFVAFAQSLEGDAGSTYTWGVMLCMLCVLCMIADHLEQKPPVLRSSLLCLPDLLFLISSRQLTAQA